MNKMIYTLSFLCLFLSSTAISQTVSISGKVLRHNGSPVEGVTVTCTNAIPVTSAADGSFLFSDLPQGGTYTINGTYETDVFEGITVLDVLFGRDIILGANMDFYTIQAIAGDLNQSSSFSTFDLVLIMRASVKTDDGLPDVYWNFLGYNTTTNSPHNIAFNNLSQDTFGLEVIAIKKGDIAIDADHLPPPPEAPHPMYNMPEISAAQDEEIILEVQVSNFKGIAGFQHQLNWDTDFLEFIELQNSEFDAPRINEDVLAQGHLLIAAAKTDEPSSIDLDDGTALYTLKFKALQDFSSLVGIIEFSEDMIPLQTVYRAESGDLFLVDDTYEVGGITLVTGISGLESFELSPNPARSGTNVKIQFKDSQKTELTLFDITGKMLQSWKFDGDSFEEYLMIEKLPQGTYALKLRTDKGMVTKRLIKY